MRERPARRQRAKRDLRIGEMAALLGTTAKTLRYYESLRLLRPSMRSLGGYRLYDAAALERATLAIGLRRLGIGIPDVAAVLNGEPSQPVVRRRLVEVLDRKIRDTDEALGVLQGRREDLAARQHRLMLGLAGECLCSLVSMPCTCGRGRSPRA